MHKTPVERCYFWGGCDQNTVRCLKNFKFMVVLKEMESTCLNKNVYREHGELYSRTYLVIS